MSTSRFHSVVIKLIIHLQLLMRLLLLLQLLAWSVLAGIMRLRPTPVKLSIARAGGLATAAFDVFLFGDLLLCRK